MTIRDRFVDEVATSVNRRILDLPSALTDDERRCVIRGMREGVGAVIDTLFDTSREDGFKVVEYDLVPVLNDEYIGKYAGEYDRGYKPPDYSQGRNLNPPKSLIDSIWDEVNS